MDLKLKGKLALVTGSTAGIGYAIAEALAREGARVVVNGRTPAGVDAAVAAIASATKGNVAGFAGDLAQPDAAERVVAAYPGVEILVNNLGIFEPKDFEEIPDDDWRRFFDVNVLSGVRLARLVLPAMRARNWGRIIFISSESGVQIPAEMIHYGMTKTAQLAISRGLAESLAGTGITVNAVLPGPTKSRGVGDFVEALARAEGQTFEQYEKGFFEKVRPTSLIRRSPRPPTRSRRWSPTSRARCRQRRPARRCAWMAASSKARSRRGGATRVSVPAPNEFGTRPPAGRWRTSRPSARPRGRADRGCRRDTGGSSPYVNW